MIYIKIMNLIYNYKLSQIDLNKPFNKIIF